MKSQLYCSRECYVKAWPINNPKKNAKRSRDRRTAQPEWYRKHEPKYYRTYRGKQVLDRPWRYTFQSRRLDAKNRKLSFTITDEWCAARWNGCCEITGIAFIKNPAGKGPHPFSCTMDRIKPNLGYIPDNCRFILHAVNCMKGSGTDEQMFAIARAIVSNISRID